MKAIVVTTTGKKTFRKALLSRQWTSQRRFDDCKIWNAYSDTVLDAVKFYNRQNGSNLIAVKFGNGKTGSF